MAAGPPPQMMPGGFLPTANPEDLSPKEYSLRSNDVQGLAAVLLNWIGMTLQQAGHQVPVVALAGPQSSLKSGVVLSLLWNALKNQDSEFDSEPSSEIAEKANLWGVLAKIEEDGVTPLLDHHFWDADSIHRGDFVASIELCIALAASQEVRLLHDIFYFDEKDGVVEKVALTSTSFCDPRLPPRMVCEVVEGNVLGQRFVVGSEAVSIGRADTAMTDVGIPDDTVSGAHTEIWYDGSDFYVRDLDSTHGTEVAQPWTDDLDMLGYRDKPLGKKEKIWRGTDIVIGDTTLSCIHIEGTSEYSDFPPLGPQFQLNLVASHGPTDGQTYAVSSEGATIGSDASSSNPALTHHCIPAPELLGSHIEFFFSHFHGGFFVKSYSPNATSIRSMRMGPNAQWEPLYKGCVEFVGAGDEISIGGVVVLRCDVVPLEK